MFLKRLEIQGFKSFPEKIRLEFERGITGIVGPNGSGKSNISDAIRWVLGEQNARNLRGEKMEDIIFSGTDNRRPLGFAEVSIILDNTDKKLNLDYSEIKITRKVYRSGESGYFINGSSCRLKDIHEIFMDTGIGKEGYSIIGQGKIDAILSNKSEDRRALFEEAVGIIKFKNRKIQAENRLQEVRKNLIRTNDIICELEKQIEPLLKQKEKAKEFLTYSEQLKLIRINLFVQDYKKSEKDIESIDKDILSLLNSIHNLENEKEAYTKRQEELKQVLLQKEQELKELNKEFSSLSINVETKQNDIKLVNQNIQFLENDISRIQEERLKNTENIIKKQEEISIIDASFEAKNLEYSLKDNELKELLQEFEKFTTSIYKEEEEIKRINNDIVEKMYISSEISNKLTVYKTSKAQYNEKNIQIQDSIKFYKSRLIERNTKKLVLEKSLSEIVEKEKSFKKDMDEFSNRLEVTKREIHSIKSKYFENNNSYIELKNKYQILKELEKDYEGYFNSVKFILKEREHNPSLSGICGAIGELISVPKQYETSIEIALGSSIQNIVTNTEEDAKVAISYLKDTKNGRATFLPVASIKGRGIGKEKEKFMAERGFIGVADELIEFDSQYSQVISSLLGRVVVIDSIDNAISFCKKYKYTYKVVTLDGDIINTGGALTGGSIVKKTGAIFSRSREITEILQNISNLERTMENTNGQIKVKQDEQDYILKNIEKLKEDISNISIEKTKTVQEIKQVSEYIQEIETNLKNREEELISLENSLELSFSDIDVLEKELIEVNKDIADLKQNISSYEIKLQEGKTNKEIHFNKINSLKMDLKDIQNGLENGKKDILRITSEIKDLDKAILSLNKVIEQNEQKKKNFRENILNIQGNIKTLKEDSVLLQEKYDLKIEEKQKVSRSIEDISKDILKSTEDISELESQKIRLETNKNYIQSKIDSLVDNMWDEYTITYASAYNDYERFDLSYKQLKDEENIFKNKIAGLGNVNISAIEEYKAIKERYDFNIKQRDDILKADEDLKDIISTLVIEMEEQFKEQFSLINKNFNEVFSKIFGGGTAKLKLSDEQNILTSGIDIVASPPGKKLQSLNLLSGGERTLTAVSLLFAILKMKPSPFCILDEAEAALDDANVTRYSDFLKKFSNDNQFIIITHKTGTMEIADVLYGVTMEEQGISKVISVELKEAKKY